MMFELLHWLTVFVQERGYEWGWGMHPMWWMGGAWAIGMIFMMLVFWILVIVGLVLGIRWLISEGRERRSDSAIEILRQRYARGEINKEEFEAKKRDLSLKLLTSSFNHIGLCDAHF